MRKLIVTQTEEESAYRKAVTQFRQGELQDAGRLCQAILEFNPRHLGALNLSASCELESGNAQEAVNLLTKALRADPNNAITLSNLSNALLAQNRLPQALEACTRALALQPAIPQGRYIEGNILSDLGRNEEALASYTKALQLRPGYLQAHINRAVVLTRLGRSKEARAAYDEALAIDPDDATALGNRANVLLQLGEIEAALADSDRALSRRSSDPVILVIRGQVLSAQRRYDEALSCFEHALLSRPGDHDALEQRARTLCDARRFEAAGDAFRELAAHGLLKGANVGHRLHQKMHCCDWDSLAALIDVVTESVRTGGRSIDPLPFLAISDDPSLHRQCAVRYVQDHAPERVPRSVQLCDPKRDRIRIAYISGYFYDQATSRLAVGLFELHDRREFEVIGVSTGPLQDSAMRSRLESAFDEFVDVGGKTDEEAALLLRERGIDILVGLLGFNRGSRMGIMAHRPAPIQINYLVFPGTLGAPYVDYIIADRQVISTDEEHCYVENVVYLPNSYQPNDANRETASRILSRDSVGLGNDCFVYCCFNGPWKITPTVFDVWMRVLARVPQSVLWLHGGYAPAAVVPNLRLEAARRGIDPERLLFASWMPSEELLASYMLADLFLDTFPCNAHTTASDALWAGLPVLTCKGKAFASRVAASLLHAAGLDEMVTENFRDYENLAVALACDRPRLANVRERLGVSCATHPLFDTGGYCRNLDSAFRLIWDRHLRGELPASFSVG